MTKQELWFKVNKEDNGRIADAIFHLYGRWLDEHEYEDIDDYLKAIQKKVPEAFTMHKRPFGFTAKCDDGNIRITVKTRGNYLQLEGRSEPAQVATKTQDVPKKEPKAKAAPQAEDLASKTSAELRKIAKEQGIPNFGNMTKEQLVTCLNDPSKIDAMNAQVRAKLADQATRRAARA